MDKQVQQWKLDRTKELSLIIDKYRVVGVLSLRNLPSAQLQDIRKQLRGKADIITAKQSILRNTLKQTKFAGLTEKIIDMPALILSELGAFKLSKLLEQKKMPAYAKAGQLCPKDILVEAGMTSFLAGPVISELMAVGIKTKVTDGKLEILAPVTVCKAGDKISPRLATILRKLDKKPMKIGLNLIAAYDEEVIYTAEQLSINVEDYITKLTQAHMWAFNLGINAEIITKETLQQLLAIGSAQADALASKINLN